MSGRIAYIPLNNSQTGFSSGIVKNGELFVDEANKTFSYKSLLAGNAIVQINANQANTLTTARTITLAGDMVGSAAFDGSTNITITATNAYTDANISALI
jgi:hypothetical protein